jgi:hypothetical protein
VRERYVAATHTRNEPPRCFLEKRARARSPSRFRRVDAPEIHLLFISPAHGDLDPRRARRSPFSVLTLFSSRAPRVRHLEAEAQDFDGPVPKDGALVYGETFVFDVAPGHAGELRVQLFKKREGIVADSKAVVANAGVYVKNIVTHITAHGAIDKDFKLFSKGGEASGGFVRLRVLYEAIADETGARAIDDGRAGGG